MSEELRESFDNPIAANCEGGRKDEATPIPLETHVTECSTVHSILMACTTTGHTALYAYFAYSSDEEEKEKIFRISDCGTYLCSIHFLPAEEA